MKTTALILLSPGALIAALIIWPKFRTVALCVLGVVMIWATVVICSAKGAHAEDVMVSCQLNKRDAPVIAEAGYCRLFKVLKEHALEDMGHGEFASFVGCMRRLNYIHPTTDGYEISNRTRLCNDVDHSAQTDWRYAQLGIK